MNDDDLGEKESKPVATEADAAADESDSTSAGPLDEAADKPTATGTDKPDPVKVALARLDVMMMGKEKARPKNRSFVVVALLLVALLWVVILVVGWRDPRETSYPPLPPATPERLTAIGGGLAVAFPPGWTPGQTRQQYAGPEGVKLFVTFTSTKLLLISPNDLHNRPILKLYRSAAYRNSLAKRITEVAEVIEARYIALGGYRGMEARARLRDGSLLRCFVVVQNAPELGVVQQPFRALELRFRIPGGMETPAWRQAENIFRSLAPAPPPAPRPATTKPVRGEKPVPRKQEE